MTAPFAVRVTRYACPSCARTHSSRRRAFDHMDRCWHNPAARGCKTCKHFEQDPGDVEVGLSGGEWCEVGVDLTGHRACPACGGHGWADISSGAQVPCGPQFTDLHIGNGAAVKPGPIVHCSLWERKEEDQ